MVETFPLATAGVEIDDTNCNNIIFAVKDTELYVLVKTLPTKDNQKLSKIISKEFERSVNWNEYKTWKWKYKKWV